MTSFNCNVDKKKQMTQMTRAKEKEIIRKDKFKKKHKTWCFENDQKIKNPSFFDTNLKCLNK